MTDRAELERAVIEAARDCARARPGWMPDDPRSFVGNTKSKWVLLNEALAALDSLPPQPDARAFTEERVREIAKDATYAKIEGLVERAETMEKKTLDITDSLHNAIDRVEERLATLEARVEDQSQRIRLKAFQPAPAPQPEAKGMTHERRYERAATYCGTNEPNEGHLSRKAFLREAREIELAALEEARDVRFTYVSSSPTGDAEGVAQYRAAIDRLIEKRSKP